VICEMYKNRTIGVIVRAYNEEKFISSVLETVPGFVDKIYVVNDASTDRTLEIIRDISKRDSRITTISRERRGGAGSAAISGLQQALLENVDIVATMDGDGQMTPSLLSSFCDPLISGAADYAKGTRLTRREHLKQMPAFRLLGNLLLTNLTRMASGYWDITDPQNGYTAIRREVLKEVDLERLEGGYAFENDMLVKLNVVGARVIDIPHPAIYGGQISKIRYTNFIFKTSWILLKGLVWRIWAKYLRRVNAIFEKAIGPT
jgi:glycosyltransferase involved in cell wall biosynthesis